MSFEKNLEKLEEIAKKLENKEMSLDEGISLYEEGLNLTKECLKSLSENKGKITLLTKEMDKLIQEPFGGDE